ncbi:hypothetical protein [Alteromonas sp. P256]|uniref:hypothetical protein n=1 Tax=Alteromonas sp. P256 TaxID=3117399 RepID=UPI002FE1E553
MKTSKQYFGKSYLNSLCVLISVSLITGCSGTGRFTEEHTLNIKNSIEQSEDIEPSLSAIFLRGNQPYRIAFCEAQRATSSCIENDKPSATGLGGFFLPLKLDLIGVDVKSAMVAKGNTIELTSTVDAPVNKISSTCGNVDGVLTFSDSYAKLEFPSTYCNWMGIGNVAQSMSFSIERIDVDASSFSGFYKIAFYGTGNASGSGYFTAFIEPSEFQPTIN